MGGALTAEGTIEAVQQMNRKRELHDKLDVLLETGQAAVLSGMIDLMYAEIVTEPVGDEQ